MIKRHYYELDRINVILCLIVVFIHAFGKIPALLPPDSFVHMMSSAVLRNCAFAVQGFIFLSALKYSMAAHGGHFRYFSFLKKRLARVYFPYVKCVIVYYICLCAMKRFGHGFDFGDLLHFIFDGTLEAHFYFVIVIMQFYLLMPFWTGVIRRLPTMVIVVSGIAIYITWAVMYAAKTIYYDRILLSYIQFWLAGIAAGKNYTAFTRLIKKNTMAIVSLFVLFIIIDGSGFYLIESSLTVAYFFEGLHTLYAFFAILSLYALSLGIEKKPSFITSCINNLSYEIYLWHCLLLIGIDSYIDYISPTSVWGTIGIRVGGVYIIILIFCLVISAIKRRRSTKELRRSKKAFKKQVERHKQNV